MESTTNTDLETNQQTDEEPNRETTVAARVAGEDICFGDFVTVFNEVIELPSFLWNCSGYSLPPEEPVRLRYVSSNAGVPHQVIGICLPFVYVRKPKGAVITIDTRTCQLVRLDKNCAQEIWRELKTKSWKKEK